MVKYKFSHSLILNLDETGTSTIQGPGFIVAPKEQENVVIFTSWERGKHNSNLHSERRQ